MDRQKVDELIHAYVDADRFLTKFWDVFPRNPNLFYADFVLRLNPREKFSDVWKDLMIQFTWRLLETLRVDFDQDDRLLDHMLFAELDMVPDRVIQIGRYSYFNGLDFVFVLRKTLRRLAYHFQSGNWEEGRLYGNEYEFNRKELFTDDQLMEVFETGRNWTGLICAFSDAEKYHFPNRGGDLSAAGCLLRIEFARLIRYLRSIDHQLPAEFVFPAFGTLRNDEQIVWSKSIPKIILRKIFAEHGQREMPPTTFKNRCRQGKIILHPDDHMANSARVDVRCLPPGWEKHLKKSSQN